MHFLRGAEGSYSRRNRAGLRHPRYFSGDAAAHVGDPKAARARFFELARPELNACHRLLEQEKRAIQRADGSVEGFNIGANDGEVAGQTVFTATCI